MKLNAQSSDRLRVPSRRKRSVASSALAFFEPDKNPSFSTESAECERRLPPPYFSARLRGANWIYWTFAVHRAGPGAKN